MQFPKYIETAAGELYIFSSNRMHISFAQLLESPVASAGMVSASALAKGKFFGESTTLLVQADKSLDWSKHEWFEGLLNDEEIIFANSVQALSNIGATEVLPADWHEVNGVRFPSSGRLPDTQVLDYFLP